MFCTPTQKKNDLLPTQRKKKESNLSQVLKLKEYFCTVFA